MTVQMTIIGLGQIGASLGLALASQTQQLTRTGHDKSFTTTRQAEKIGAIDKVEHNLHAAVEKADIVVLAIPVDEIRGTLEQIAPDLQNGAVVLDMSPVKTAVTHWAVELLPEGRNFVSFMPTLNPNYLVDTGSGIDAAHDDLFKDGLIMISSPSGTDPDAVKLASDLGLLIGAQSLFSDPAELDGLAAATHSMPRMVSAAVVNALIDQPGWTEGRKLAGRAFAVATEPLMHLDETKVLGKSLILNRDNVVRVTNDVIEALVNLRNAVAAEDEETLNSLMQHALQGRETWWKQRVSHDWSHTTPPPEMPSAGDVMARFFGFRRKKKEEK